MSNYPVGLSRFLIFTADDPRMKQNLWLTHTQARMPINIVSTIKIAVKGDDFKNGKVFSALLTALTESSDFVFSFLIVKSAERERDGVKCD